MKPGSQEARQAGCLCRTMTAAHRSDPKRSVTYLCFQPSCPIPAHCVHSSLEIEVNEVQYDGSASLMVPPLPALGPEEEAPKHRGRGRRSRGLDYFYRGVEGNTAAERLARAVFNRGGTFRG